MTTYISVSVLTKPSKSIVVRITICTRIRNTLKSTIRTKNTIFRNHTNRVTQTKPSLIYNKTHRTQVINIKTYSISFSYSIIASIKSYSNISLTLFFSNNFCTKRRNIYSNKFWSCSRISISSTFKFSRIHRNRSNFNFYF